MQRFHRHFDGDRLLFDSANNVSFSATRPAQLVGQMQR
jgi:hypothetical protein